MKKSLLFSLSLFLGISLTYSQTTYEIGEGKTYAKLGDVLSATVIGASSDTEFIINMEEGVYTEGAGTNNVAFSLGLLNLGNKKVTIVGAGADKTIIQRQEAKLVVVQDVKNVNPGRLFHSPNTGEADGLELICKNITFRNMGQTFNNSNAALVDASGKGQKYTFENCMFQNLYARQGPIFFAPTGRNSITLESCFVEECGNYFRGICSGLIAINGQGGDVKIKNTTFMDSRFSFEDTNTTGGGVFDNPKSGQVLHINNNNSVETDESNVIFENSNIVNSSFNAPLTNMGAMIKIVSVGAGTFNVKLDKLVSVGNSRAGGVDCDFYYDPTKLTPIVTNSMMNGVKSIVDDSDIETLSGATIDKTLTYNSTGVNFEMDGSVPKIFINEKGVKYLKFETPNSIEDVEIDAPTITFKGSLITISNINQGTTIYIYDLTGKLIENQKVSQTSVDFNLPQGMYVLKIGDYTSKVKI